MELMVWLESDEIHDMTGSKARKEKKGKHGASADFNQSIFFAKANLTVQSPRETGHPSDFQRRGQRQNCAPEKRFVAFQVIPLKST
jgi:hypothetical protein